ncbi:diaminopimelate epimerase [Bifidobacterium sp. B4107]|uniref:diaminopimelate epimerase n=1 Tax=unclassified Bifidobacterium TaxID=2608897 RepID=UPI00226BA939|nr:MULTISPECIES: diaminopimelate epimerase [unclassified Bifidobacterium]MCX8648404.1 diaminopimelate epimerase [Bifidobacterium sp. B4107]MCX8652604.1 diaminopimelate epimerase [Bifidobacterium sp. B4111]MCX8659032.1 diaminopimelate epimerase [Bifidobacterium sp. B4114]
MSIPRTVYKMQATGNDFVVYADPRGDLEPTADQVRWLCDRHFGVGADGVIRLTHPADVSDLDQAQVDACDRFGCQWFMDYRNADGSLAQMCGNGTRAITLFAQKQGLTPTMEGSSFLLGTRAGVKRIVSCSPMKCDGEHVFMVKVGAWRMGPVGQQLIDGGALGGSAPGTMVDMGNPHAVVLTAVAAELEASGLPGTVADLLAKTDLPDPGDLDLSAPPRVRPGLAEGQNVEFLRLDALDADNGSGRATMRVYERGVGETLSCGTGLCASGVLLRALTGVDHWTIHVGGGCLKVDVDPQDVWLTGPARMVARLTLEHVPGC